MDNTVYIKNITEELKTRIKCDVDSGIDRPQSKYIENALENLKRNFQIEKRFSRYHAWSITQRKEVMDIWKEILPEVMSIVDRLIQEYKHKKLTKDIRATTAKAVIKAAMQEAGIRHHFVGQTHRAKVSVLITQNRALTFYISYKKLHEQLPGIVESLKLIRQELESLGNNVSINKIYNFGEFI